MSKWRDKGFVQDSDEEEDLDISDTSNPQKENGYASSEENQGPTGDAGVAISEKGTETGNVEDIEAVEDVPSISGTFGAPLHLVGTTSRNNSPRARPSLTAQTEPNQAEDGEPIAGTESDLDELQGDLPPLAHLIRRTSREKTIQYSSSRGHSNPSTERDDIPPGPLSSPLSEYSTTPVPPDFAGPLTESQKDGSIFSRDIPTGGVQVIIPIQDRNRAISVDGSEQELAETRGGRTFRARKAIQIHPYIIEQELYKQTLRAKGLKPVIVAPESSGKRNQTPDPESQDHEFEEEETQPSSPPASSQLANGDPSPSAQRFVMPPVSPALFDMDDDGDLPDLDALLSRKVPEGIQEGYKRRKTKQTFSKRNRAAHQNSEVRSLNSPDIDPYVVPPSPPTSNISARLSAIKPRRKAFRVPRGFTPVQPPTPVASSETRPPLQNITQDESDEDFPRRSTLRRRGRLLPTASLVVSSSSSSEDNSTGQEASDSEELRLVQKRIKGVLPASWLKLDKQIRNNNEQTAKKVQPRRPVSPEQLESQRGVAKRIVRVSGSALNRPSGSGWLNDTVFISDESDNAASEVHPQDTFGPPNISLCNSAGTNRTRLSAVNVEIAEDDWIDPIFPSSSRATAPAQPSEKRQTKLSDSFGLPRKRFKGPSGREIAPSSPRRGHIKQRRNREKVSQKSTTTRPGIPRMGILDAHHSYDTPLRGLPQFIRVAVRQAFRQPNMGRQSPTGKHIRLQTHDDTEDANQVLREWRAGTLAPSTDMLKLMDIPRQRKPLVDKANNYQQLDYPSPVRKPAATPSHLRHISRRTSENSSRLRQSKLNPIHVKQYQTDSDITTTTPTALIKATQRQPAPMQVYRTAQLEGLETEFDRRNRKAAFQKKLTGVDRHFMERLNNDTLSTNPQLARFLADEGVVMPPSDPNTNLSDPAPSLTEAPKPPLVPVYRRPRKRRVCRLDVQAREFRQPSEPPPEVFLQHSINLIEEQEEAVVLLGLGAFGTHYTADFDVLPLEVGTFFHESTFIGCGEFSKSMRLLERDLDISTGHSLGECYGKTYRWSSWTEDVAAQLTEGFQVLLKNLEISAQLGSVADGGDQSRPSSGQNLSFLRSLIQYFSDSLSFLDPIDRRSFTTKLFQLLDQTFNTLLPLFGVTGSDLLSSKATEQQVTRITTYTLVLTYETYRIASHSNVEAEVRKDLETLLRTISQKVINILVQKGMRQLRDFLEENRRHVLREAGIRTDKHFLEALVVLSHVLDQPVLGNTALWDLITEELSPRIVQISQVQSLERIWYDIFTFLPFLEFDSTGVVQNGRRFKASRENWGLPKSMIHRTLTLYSETSKSHSASINSYIRALLRRCHNLIQRWGWRRCEPVLNVVFDFFARSGLAQLRNEESRGSPRFLDQLDQHPSLEIQPEDRAFGIFLKTLCVGLKAMRKVYSDKKIRGIAWRFVPNHGRMYRKDEAIRQEDLDALRNHHDLMCTLYWASPSGFRPRLDLIRNLVDHGSSHREACRLSVRAWSRLMRFQLSTDESTSFLFPFSSWFKEILDQTLVQYRLARTEAEALFEAANHLGTNTISPELLQSTITSNENQVLATLSEAVTGMKSAVEAAKGKEAAIKLLEDSDCVAIFKLFDPKKPRLSALIVECLGVFQELAILATPTTTTIQRESQQSSEESQDYGEWPDLEEVAEVEGDKDKQNSSLEFIHEPLWHLLSSCFGAETSPDEILLTRTVDTWVQLAQYCVQAEQRHWSSYLDDYGSFSWHQLRHTEQTRKFAAYFMSSVIEIDRKSYKEHHSEFITAWLLSLVERESMLKFQHRFTTVLLNTDRDQRLLQNLPFPTDTRLGRFSITATEFRERRLSLISSILSNMRDSFEDSSRNSDLKREYTALLKHFMLAMRKNYEELQQGSVITGAYVEFVQKVVEFLQQYVSDICPVDKFFTDSAAFPLPATDPTYVVGRLKSYALKLGDPRTFKQLAVFVQTVSERAAVDKQQPYLVGQLHASMENSYESGDIRKPTLRCVLLQAIFPAYIELSFKSAAGWILAKPVLQATSRMFQDILYDFSVTDPPSLDSVSSIFSSMLDLLRHVAELLVDHSGLLEQPHVLHILVEVIHTVTSMLPSLDYIQRRVGGLDSARQCVIFFRRFTVFVAQTILRYEEAAAPYLDEDISIAGIPVASFGSIREFCVQELNQVMEKHWLTHGEQFFVVRGNMRKEVPVELGTFGYERARVIASIEEFHTVLGRMKGLGDSDRDGRRQRRDSELNTLVL